MSHSNNKSTSPPVMDTCNGKISNNTEERNPLCLLAKLDSTHRLNLTLENLVQVKGTLDGNPWSAMMLLDILDVNHYQKSLKILPWPYHWRYRLETKTKHRLPFLSHLFNCLIHLYGSNAQYSNWEFYPLGYQGVSDRDFLKLFFLAKRKNIIS